MNKTIQPILEIKKITKTFGDVLANDGISFQLMPGEIHAILGENGAGKTTLMNIISGLIRPDHGEIWLKNKKMDFVDTQDAINAGIGMVHQHFMLIPVLTVTENIMLGKEMKKLAFFLNRREASKKISELSELYGLDVNPSALIKDLPVGIQQRVEILKLLYRDSDIFILDEPTAFLSPIEIRQLTEIMKALKERGKSIIFITHKLKEVFQVADKITVMRGGRIVGSTTPAQTDENALATMMVDRDIELDKIYSPTKHGKSIFKVTNLTVENDKEKKAIFDLSFEIKEGEIFGIAGVQGNGQTELVEAITGLRPLLSGSVVMNGIEMTHKSHRDYINQGLAYIPEDRQKDGLVLSYPITSNLILSRFHQKPYSRNFILQEKKIASDADWLIRQYSIKATSRDNLVSTLSGGNQQKVIIARELSGPSTFIVASQPTRGLDIGSIDYIHGLLIQKRNEGAGILLISYELDELLSLSDRVLVLYCGSEMGTVVKAETNKEEMGKLMAGIKNEK